MILAIPSSWALWFSALTAVAYALPALAASRMGRDSICAWCSRMKRGILYSTARAHGYGTLVLGQHLDDCAESFVMSAFRNGALRTMKAAYTNDAGDVRVIRPLAYCRERATRGFADAMRLPVIADNCPACFAGPTERYHVKALLAKEEATNANLFSSLRRAMRALMADDGARALGAAADAVDERISAGAAAAAKARGAARAAAKAAPVDGGGGGGSGGSTPTLTERRDDSGRITLDWRPHATVPTTVAAAAAAARALWGDDGDDDDDGGGVGC